MVQITYFFFGDIYMANSLNSVEQMMLEKINKAIKIIDSYDIKYIEYGVFGSAARGDYKITSDVDIAMLVDTMPEKMVLSNLRCDLEAIGCDFAILYKHNYEQPTTAFQREVKRDYRRLKLYGE